MKKEEKTTMQEKLMQEIANQLMSLTGCLNGLISLLFENEVNPETADTPNTPAVSLEDIRAILAEKSRDGYTTQVRALLEKHGAGKLSEIDPSKYAVLLAEAEGLGND